MRKAFSERIGILCTYIYSFPYGALVPFSEVLCDDLSRGLHLDPVCGAIRKTL